MTPDLKNGHSGLTSIYVRENAKKLDTRQKSRESNYTEIDLKNQFTNRKVNKEVNKYSVKPRMKLPHTKLRKSMDNEKNANNSTERNPERKYKNSRSIITVPNIHYKKDSH